MGRISAFKASVRQALFASEKAITSDSDFAEQLRILLALMVLLVCGKLAFDLLVMPSELFSIGAVEGH